MKKKAVLISLLLAVALSVVISRLAPGRKPVKQEGGVNSGIISLGPYVTENLFLLGLEKNIVGLTIHDSARRREGKEIIGTLIDPNIEKIVSLRPAIVIASKEGNRPESIREINRLGIKTLVLEELHSFEDICKNFQLLGDRLGAGRKAAEIIESRKLKLERLRAGLKSKEKKKVFFILGFKPLFTTGGKTYINEIISFAGGINIFGGVDKKWFACSREEVIRRNPEFIIFTGMEKETVPVREMLHGIRPIRDSDIWEMDDTVIGSPTPDTFVDSVEILAWKLHGER